MLKVAIQGYAASFHDVAAHAMLGDDLYLVPCDTFKGVFDAVLEGRAEYGVVAIENTMYGLINESHALLEHADVNVVDEDVVRVEQCLLALPGARLEDIREVYSHPVALMQCDEFLHGVLPQARAIEHADTAGAAADVAKWGNPTRAAIASRAAAEYYGLQVLAPDIATEKHNYTRFVLFTR